MKLLINIIRSIPNFEIYENVSSITV